MLQQAKYPDLDGAAVLITGGGSGIGAALTEGFVAQGARVAFIDIAEGPSEALRDRIGKQHGSTPLFIKCDLRDIDALARCRSQSRGGARRGDRADQQRRI